MLLSFSILEASSTALLLRHASGSNFSLHILPARDTCYLGVYGGDHRPEVTSSVGWARGVFYLTEEHHQRLELMGSGETVAVDFNFVMQWLAECEANHLHDQADAKHASASESPAIPQAKILLIDVDENKLVHANSSARYVALSYVWDRQGTTVHKFETTTATLDQLLTSLATVSGIPIVVLDAMQLVASVGERYLWVDRLCIVQDYAMNKHENISQMDIIYANAVFTVVAASGISGDIPLLPGVRPGYQSAASLSAGRWGSLEARLVGSAIRTQWFALGHTRMDLSGDAPLATAGHLHRPRSYVRVRRKRRARFRGGHP